MVGKLGEDILFSISSEPTPPDFMKLIRTDLPDVMILEPVVHADERGWFMETFSEQRFHAELQRVGLPTPRRFVQDNQSLSRQGVLRGLHLQLAPQPQGKLVRVLRGRIYDVAVDVRAGSPTFGRWVGTELSAANRRQMWVPEGFAHGFLGLDDQNEVAYKTTDYYCRDCERGIAWNDPAIGIAWPLDGRTPLVAPKDAALPVLADARLA